MNILPIASPPWNTLGKKIESTLRRAIFEFGLLEGVDKLAIALSGGKDSLSLLFLLKAIAGFGVPPFEIVAINVSGEYTCGAGIGQGYLKSICDALEVPLIVKNSQKTLENLECYSCSRERRSLLFHAAKEAGCKTIAFGHHQDDNAQTLLMNLFHKGEFAGLLPKLKMIDYDITIIRPLIHIQEEQIREFAKYYGFARVTCQCPVGQNSKRKVTDKLLTEIAEHFPHARSNIANASLTYGSQKARLEHQSRS
jgi:tRNA 2-thiocytidine biosynthesis protein TtcA